MDRISWSSERGFFYHPDGPYVRWSEVEPILRERDEFWTLAATGVKDKVAAIKRADTAEATLTAAPTWAQKQKVRAETLRRCAEEIENAMRNRVVKPEELVAWYRAQAENMDLANLPLSEAALGSSPAAKEQK